MRFCYSFDPEHTEHTQSGHPENHRRLEAVYALLSERGLLGQGTRVPSEPAPWDAIERVHVSALIERLHMLASGGAHRADADTYLTPTSVEIARRATGGSLACVDHVLSGTSDAGFALNRPPGHHATPDQAMGFCLFNHIAVAARHAQDRHGLDRIAIFDFDVHHGNGTQDIFYEDPSVLFMSVHQSPLYPGTGAVNERGTEAGRGTTVNLPLPAGCGDDVYAAAMRTVFEPVLYAYKPDLVLVSAGYDAHWHDPLAGMHLSVQGLASIFTTCLEWADQVCGGRTVAFLEGGYDLDALSYAVLACVSRLLDPEAEIEDPIGKPASDEPDLKHYLNDVAGLHGVG